VVFGLHAEVHSVIMMSDGRFCFINTTSIEGATKAMGALQGSRVNGSEIKINFAKDKCGQPAMPSCVLRASLVLMFDAARKPVASA
jgi:hypothetical protein